MIDTILTVVGLAIAGIGYALKSINTKFEELRADTSKLKDQVRATDIDIYKNQVVIVEKAAYEKGFREGKAAVK